MTVTRLAVPDKTSQSLNDKVASEPNLSIYGGQMPWEDPCYYRACGTQSHRLFACCARTAVGDLLSSIYFCLGRAVLKAGRLHLVQV